MHPRIKDVKPLENYILLVTFDTKIKKYDMKNWFNHKNFKILKDKIIFNMVQVDVGGYGISWNDEVDL
ncbi:MAG: DUF2442 domain-containing protein [Anaeromicrobium sp.]|jgi:hypothetical protein|uniref:DUF2442 domain-containing protein n=1 Tax=Anaeromicrobium sp. TaxID=1929132 RepID=UPI0025D0FD09|nr:DUF2442 domain-containing protein [Anaeromicrobium sp.]MCT4595454.1 DUF2442 domain-containing protein [Anaeromicrobium sp.]